MRLWKTKQKSRGQYFEQVYRSKKNPSMDGFPGRSVVVLGNKMFILITVGSVMSVRIRVNSIVRFIIGVLMD
jgi:hypothetical protein